MRVIKVRVIPNAKKNKVSEENGELVVHVTSSPVGGKANKVLIKVLADYFKVKRKYIKIVRGLRSRKKIIEIKEDDD